MDTARMPINIPDIFDPVFSFMDTSPSIDDPNSKPHPLLYAGVTFNPQQG